MSQYKPANTVSPALSAADHCQDATPARIPFREKFAYALGDTAFVLYWHTWSTFLMIFYTDVFGIEAAAVGVMFGIARLFDAVNDPFMGLIADRTNTRFGKFRPWLMWGVIPFMVFGVLLFTVPDFSPGWKLVYAYVTYLGATVAYTAINIPYGALMGVMSSNPRDRTELAAFRSYGANVAVLFVNFSLLTLVASLGQGDEAAGYQRTMIAYSLIAGSLLMVVFFGTKERVRPSVTQDASLWADLRLLSRNVPWIVVSLVGILTLLWTSVRNGTLLYYLKYLVNADATTINYFLVGGTIASLAGVALASVFEKQLGGKRNAYMLFTFLAAATSLAIYFVDSQNWKLTLGLYLLSQFFLGPPMPYFWSMIADAADYAEWKFSRRNTGLTFSTGTLAQKSGGALAGTITGLLLGSIGYAPNQSQTPEAIEGIRALFTYLPAALAVLPICALLFYPITIAVLRQMESDLAARHATSDAAAQSAESAG